MAPPPAPHTDLRKAGLAAAMVVGLLLAAGLAVVVMTRRHTPAPSGGNKPPTTNQPEIPPDVADTGVQTGNARVQFADRKDPGRAAGMIEWSRLEPITQFEKRLIEPRGYIYMRDGGLIVVTSKTGLLNTTPKVQEPQSGRFEGGVTLKLYPAGINPDSGKPTLTANSDSLDFDIPSASVSTTGAFTVRSTSFDIDGSGMRLIANQLEEGIERFEVARITLFTMRPDAKDPLQSAGAAASKPTPGAKQGPDRLRTYRAVVEGAVKLTQGKRTMYAERAEAWAHLINNRLQPGAVGRLGPEPASESTPASGQKPPSSTSTTAPAEDTTITGTWTGRLVVTPAPETGEGAQPPEFGGNKASLRLTAGQTPVTVTDESFKGTMKAARVDYGATERILTLGGTPNMPVQIDTATAGSLKCKGATVNLGSGKIDLDGPGDLFPAADALAKAPLPGAAPAAPAKPEPVPTNLTFAQGLTLNFKTVGNWITPDAQTATVKGGFTANSGQVKASADEATVKFRERVGDKTSIEQITLKGNAQASAPAASLAASLPTAAAPDKAPDPAKPADPTKRDTLKGQELTVKFEPDAAGQDQPKSLTVTGGAEATAGGGSDGLKLKARTITADLGKDAKGDLAVVKAEATEEVHISDNPAGGPSTFTASADKLTVDPATGIARLTGAPVTVSRDGAVMTGTNLRLTQSTGEVFADGPGTISSIKEGEPLKNDPTKHSETTYALASWQKSMTFNNITGKATCLGDASATMTVGQTARNTAQAETIVLSFTPAPTEKPAPGQASPPRELLNAEAIGELGVDGKPPRPATVEAREFSVVNGEQRLERLTYLEGQRIIADQQKQTLDVPVPGKLLVDDRTPEPQKVAASTTPPAASASPIGGFTSTKGTSLFTWMGSLNFDMVKGEATLKKDVALTHQPLPAPGQPAPAQTTLDCDELTGFLKTQKPTGAPSAPAPTPLGKIDATLERVEAKGNVIAKSDGSQLTADSVTFDTIKQFIEAAGSNDAERTLVTYLNPSRPTPLRARKVTWDQKSGDIRIIEPAPTTIGN